MKAVNALGLYILFLASILAIVLTLTLSKTMSSEQLSLENIFTQSVQKKLAAKSQNISKTEENPNKYIPMNRLAFTQFPFTGEASYKSFQENVEPNLKKINGCLKKYNVVLENCVGMFEKRDDCDVLQLELEEECVIETNEDDDSSEEDS